VKPFHSKGFPSSFFLLPSAFSYISKLRTLELLKDPHTPSRPYVAGVAYGSYARSLLSSFLGNSLNYLESDLNLLFEAVNIAFSLI
jgi:hypothetical protein